MDPENCVSTLQLVGLNLHSLSLIVSIPSPSLIVSIHVRMYVYMYICEITNRANIMQYFDIKLYHCEYHQY